MSFCCCCFGEFVFCTLQSFRVCTVHKLKETFWNIIVLSGCNTCRPISFKMYVRSIICAWVSESLPFSLLFVLYASSCALKWVVVARDAPWWRQFVAPCVGPWWMGVPVPRGCFRTTRGARSWGDSKPDTISLLPPADVISRTEETMTKWTSFVIFFHPHKNRHCTWARRTKLTAECIAFTQSLPMHLLFVVWLKILLLKTKDLNSRHIFFHGAIFI